MTYKNEYEMLNYKDLKKVTCPNPSCFNIFYVDGSDIGRNFQCVKCGSSWYSKRLQQKEANS